EFPGVYGPFLVRVEYRYIRRRTGRQRACRQTERRYWAASEHINNPRERDTLACQGLQHDSQSRLQPDHSEWRVVKFQHFFVLMMWRVVRRYRINSSVSNAFNERLSIGFRPERRVHFGIGVKARNRFVGQ